jgi:hypothetical protein
MHEYGSQEGISDDAAPEDTVSQTPAPTASGGPQPTPKEHAFTIRDSADVPGLLHQGGCELRLDPVVGGKVHLMLLASGIGVKECGDTTSVWVKSGIPSRWWLSWKAAGDKCIVSISRMTVKKAEAPPR